MYKIIKDATDFNESMIRAIVDISSETGEISVREVYSCLNLPNPLDYRAYPHMGWDKYTVMKEISLVYDSENNHYTIFLPDPVKLEKRTDENTIVPKEVLDPPYYIEGKKYQPRKVIADWHLSFNLGNAVKYISRCGKKETSPKIEDLRKAIRYIEFEIEEFERSNKEGGE